MSRLLVHVRQRMLSCESPVETLDAEFPRSFPCGPCHMCGHSSLLGELGASWVTPLGGDPQSLCLVSSDLTPLSFTLCWFYFVSFGCKNPQPHSLLFSTINTYHAHTWALLPRESSAESQLYLCGFDTMNNLLLFSPGSKAVTLCLKKKKKKGNLFLKITELAPSVPSAAQILFFQGTKREQPSSGSPSLLSLILLPISARLMAWNATQMPATPKLYLPAQVCSRTPGS